MSIDYGKYIEKKEGKIFIKGLYNSNYSDEDNRDKINIFQILHYLRTNKNYKNKEIIIVEDIYLSSLKNIKNLSKEENINPEKINNKLKITFKENVIILDCNIKDGVNFGGCVFEQKVNFNGSAFEQGVNFGINTYKQEVNFEGSIFEKGVNFSGSTFEQEANFFESTFKQKVHFEVSIFKGKANFSKNKFEQEINFNGSTFEQEVNFSESKIGQEANFSRSSFKQEVNFKGSIFEGEAKFGETIFEQEANFSLCTYKQGVYFGKNMFKQVVYFMDSSFKQKVNFYKSSFEKDIYFNRSIFEQEAKFHNTKFSKNVRFHECEFKGVTIFNNTKFEKLADFYYTIFFQPQQFLLVDFFDRAVFSNATFEKECQFLFCRVSKDSHINFESATFNKGLDISRSNFTCDVNFWNIKLEEPKEIFSSNYYTYDFPYKKIEGNPDFYDTKFLYKKIRESYRIIKNNLFNQNDKINGLEYQKREMEAYWKELNLIREQKQPKKSEKKLIITNIIGGFVVSLFFVLYSFRECKVYFWLSLISFIGTFYISFRQKGIGINLKNMKNNLIKKPLFSVSSIILILIVAFLILIFRDLYYLKNNLKFYIIVLALTFIITLLALLDYEKDRYLLFFNKYSNNFGTNWVRGVAFTLVIGLIFYGIFIPSLNVKYDFSLTLEGVKNFMESFLAIINVIDFKPFDNEKAFIKAEDLSGWSYLILFIGRIFIGYGYYQTIQAFRKFGKS